MSQDKTHFGFKEVDTEKKVSLVKDVFDSVAPNYDIMNDLMSLGIHRIWKNVFIDMLCASSPESLLDMAGGTGDISFKFIKARRKQNRPFKVTVCDINQEMLNVGKKRSYDEGYIDPNLSWVCADAEKLPFPDNSFDAYTISFGLRNVTNIDNAIKEAYRVLKPNGKFMCMEFSRVTNDNLRSIYDLYSFMVLPKVGQLVAGDKDAYQYLVESIRRFPTQEELVKKVQDAGFAMVKYQNLTGGITAIHSGIKKC